MSPPATHNALLTDFGGVLTTDIWTSFDAYGRRVGLQQGAVRRLFRERPEAVAELRRLETGDADPAEFERRFGKLLGLRETAGLIEGLFAGLEPLPEMLDAVRTARAAGVLTGLISNSWVMGHYDAELRALFDAVVISGEVGLHKPQPEIYTLAAERLGVTPERCVFVDDLRENCAGAEAVGMATVLHRDPAETIASLEELLGVDL